MADGNNAAMREALRQASYFLRRHHTGAVYAPDGETLIFCEDVAKVVDAALAAPARNCDMGTVKEQWDRFEKVCSAGRQIDDPDYCSCRCKIDGGCVNECALIWAQMPYEEGGDHA